MSNSKLVAPSPDVRAEALARARRLATGLFPHQVEGVAFLLGRRRAILADDMGLGKTRQSIVALREAAPEGPWLVITPASVKLNWGREIARVFPDDPVRIVGPGAVPDAAYRGWVLVNYDILGRHQDALRALPWTGVVFDEAHYLKNHTSQRSRLARALVEGAPDAVVHCLTGTPVTNRPRDLFPLLQLVRHPMARSFLSFAKRYCDATHNGYGWVTDGASNLDELRIQLHGAMLRRTKDEVLDLPPKLRSWVPVTVPAGTARKEMRRALELMMTGAQERAQAARGKARRAPVGQDRTRLLAALSKARLQLATAKVSATVDLVEGAVAQGEKVIVFTGFDAPAQAIAEHFGEQAVLLTGKTPARSRQRLVDRFQTDDDVRVFVANIVAGGVGITLTAARQVVFNDLDWVPANHWQAEDRAYRIGQTGTVTASYLVAEGTVDEFVRSVLLTKALLVDQLVEGKGEPADGDLLSELERLVGQFSPAIAEVSDADSGEDPVDRLLREVTQGAARETHADAAAQRLQQALPTLPEDAIRALARALSSPLVRRYTMASSRGTGTAYRLEVDGADVTCSCPGFEYRGACRHARGLQEALALGKALPEGVTEEG
ncbi:MAG: DEAD/DEAH box helicase [Gemmatimonadetes bacterium]|nr:DEAD/DEAH box helicase [Gemmatimonadota bacterium]